MIRPCLILCIIIINKTVVCFDATQVAIPAVVASENTVICRTIPLSSASGPGMALVVIESAVIGGATISGIHSGSSVGRAFPDYAVGDIIAAKCAIHSAAPASVTYCVRVEGRMTVGQRESIKYAVQESHTPDRVASEEIRLPSSYYSRNKRGFRSVYTFHPGPSSTVSEIRPFIINDL